MRTKENSPAISSPKAPTARFIAFLALDMLWLIQLRQTEAYLSVYLLCGLAGLAAAWDNLASRRRVHGRARVAAAVFAALFTSAVALANYGLFLEVGPVWMIVNSLRSGSIDMELFGDWIVRMAGAPFALVGGYLVAREAMVCAMARLRKWNAGRTMGGRRHPGRVFALSALAMSLIYLSFLWFISYPGILTIDSLWQMGETVTGAYSNHHPMWHTLLIQLWTRLGQRLTGDVNAGVALYSAVQAVFMACAFAFALSTLYRAGVPKGVIWGVLAVYALSPYHIAYSVTMWKDVLFGGAVLLFCCALYRIMRGLGPRWLNYGVYVLGTMGFALWRSNGWLALMGVAVFMAFTLRKRRLQLVVLTVILLAVSFVMRHPVLDRMGVEPADAAEMLSIPAQQIARVVQEDRALEPEEREVLSQVFEMDTLAKDYDPWTSDAVKNNMRRRGLEYLEGHRLELLKTWLKLGLRYPADYVRAWVEQTKGYWNAGYDYWIMEHGVIPNDLGCAATVRAPAARLVIAVIFEAYERLPLFDALHSVGLHTWLLAASLIGCAARRGREYLISLPGLMIVLTLMLSAPVYCEFRYAYALFTTLPAALCLPWLSAKRR